MAKNPCVYMLSNGKNGDIYIGVTSNLRQRLIQHSNKRIDGFSRRFKTDRLVWYENHSTMDGAIRREKRLKKWNRAWKIRLILKLNPEWKDLFDTVPKVGPPPEAAGDDERSLILADGI